MSSRLATAALLAAVITVSGAAVHQLERKASDDMAAAANAFLNVLSRDQAAQAVFSTGAPERTRWHFIPPEAFPRSGVVLRELDARQRAAAHALLQSGLSGRGYQTAKAIMALEQVLKNLQQNSPLARDSAAYYITIFGTPSGGGTWAWRFEGHHLSLHFTIVKGELTVSTPSFLGASPAEVRAPPQPGTRALGVVEDLAFALLGSFSEAQRTLAVISNAAPDDILTSTNLPAERLSPTGLTSNRMTSAQQQLLRQLIDAHASIMTPEIAAERWRQIEDAGFDNVTFAWAGATERGRPHYYRIQGRSFLVEYDNTQNDANHIHTVWRDFNGDFGADLLREHLSAVRH